jgi:hypothetical protein
MSILKFFCGCVHFSDSSATYRYLVGWLVGCCCCFCRRRCCCWWWCATSQTGAGTCNERVAEKQTNRRRSLWERTNHGRAESRRQVFVHAGQACVHPPPPPPPPPPPRRAAPRTSDRRLAGPECGLPRFGAGFGCTCIAVVVCMQGTRHRPRTGRGTHAYARKHTHTQHCMAIEGNIGINFWRGRHCSYYSGQQCAGVVVVCCCPRTGPRPRSWSAGAPAAPGSGSSCG